MLPEVEYAGESRSSSERAREKKSVKFSGTGEHLSAMKINWKSLESESTSSQ